MRVKYELLKDDNIEVEGHTLYRIRATKRFNDVKKGDLGGYIENEENLGHYSNCWVYDNAKVYGNACVCNDACVHNNAIVHDKANISGNARICDNANIFGNAQIHGDAKVDGTAYVYDIAEIFGNAQIHNEAEIAGNVYVYGNAVISNNAFVYDDARIYDNAHIYGNTKIYGNARVLNNANVRGNTTLANNAYITDTNDCITMGPIGSMDNYITFYLTEDKNIMVKIDYFNCTIEEFIKIISYETNNKYKNQYVNTITYAKCILRNESILYYKNNKINKEEIRMKLISSLLTFKY